MLTILKAAKPGGKYHAPTWLVRCPRCQREYQTTAWRSQVEQTPSCKSCQMMGNRNGRGNPART